MMDSSADENVLNALQLCTLLLEELEDLCSPLHAMSDTSLAKYQVITATITAIGNRLTAAHHQIAHMVPLETVEKLRPVTLLPDSKILEAGRPSPVRVPDDPYPGPKGAA